MANSVIKVVDSTKRLVLKMCGDDIETGTRNLKIDTSTLVGALNVNNLVMPQPGTAADRKQQYRLQLKKLYWTLEPGELGSGTEKRGTVIMSCDGDQMLGSNGNTIITMCSGYGKLDFAEGGDAFVIDCFTANSNGNLFLQTIGFTTANCRYTVIADFRKDPRDFSQGQFASPVDFNQGTGRIN